MAALILACSIAFWVGLALLAHTYFLYPVMVRLLARGRGLPEDRFVLDEALPEIAVIMAVCGEEQALEETIASILASDYPHGKLRLFVGSDASSDRGEAIVKQFAKVDRRVRLVRFGGRVGRTLITNRLAEGARSEFSEPDQAVFLLSRADVIWTPPMLRRLASHFKRARVGLVAASVHEPISAPTVFGGREGVRARRESVVNFAEGVVWGRVMGPVGPCYAIRASLFTPAPPHFLVGDLYRALALLQQGSDAVVDLEAVCHEPVSTRIDGEFRWKRCIAANNFESLDHFWSCLKPRSSDLATAFAFWSRLGLRWCVPFLIPAIFALCLFLTTVHPMHYAALAGLATFPLMAGLDWLMIRTSGWSVKPFRFARSFLCANGAIGAGFLDYLRGPGRSTGEGSRREVPRVPQRAARPASGAEPLLRR